MQLGIPLPNMTETTTEIVVPPKNDGRFKPGEAWTGNANGRARGTKNRITVQRLLLEETLRTQLEPKAGELLEKAIEMALGGNDRVMRALLDKLLATPKNDGDSDAKDTAVQITIKNLTVPEKPVLTITKQQSKLGTASAAITDGELVNA